MFHKRTRPRRLNTTLRLMTHLHVLKCKDNSDGGRFEGRVEKLSTTAPFIPAVVHTYTIILPLARYVKLARRALLGIFILCI